MGCQPVGIVGEPVPSVCLGPQPRALAGHGRSANRPADLGDSASRRGHRPQRRGNGRPGGQGVPGEGHPPVAGVSGLAGHSTATAAPCAANGASGEGAPGSELSCTWGRWLPPASIPSFGTSTSSCWPPVSRRSWLWSLVCASCSSSSTPCSSSAHPGGTSLQQSPLLPLGAKHSC